MAKLYATAEAAEYLGITQRAVQLAIKRGRLSARRIGPMWTITQASLDDYLLNNAHQPGRKPSIV